MTAICRVRYAATALALLSMEATAEEPLTTRCESGPLMAAFAGFFETGRMPQNLSRFLGDVALNKIEPYKAFDNVYYVGICWVSAWLLTSPQGHVLIDTLYGPYTDQLLATIRALDFDPKDIKLVVITHGHRDHAGGAARLKSSLDPETRFAMTREGWREAAEAAVASATGPGPWAMIEPDLVLADSGVLTAGGVTIQAFETPGHTMGTASFAYDARDGAATAPSPLVGWGSTRFKDPNKWKPSSPASSASEL
jgi:metallo-beta-lactamase class B